LRFALVLDPATDLAKQKQGFSQAGQSELRGREEGGPRAACACHDMHTQRPCRRWRRQVREEQSGGRGGSLQNRRGNSDSAESPLRADFGRPPPPTTLTPPDFAPPLGGRRSRRSQPRDAQCLWPAVGRPCRGASRRRFLPQASRRRGRNE
jgi:hypothetical protein